jgi:hypothetical protein
MMYRLAYFDDQEAGRQAAATHAKISPAPRLLTNT